MIIDIIDDDTNCISVSGNSLAEIEKNIILTLLKHHANNKTRTAKHLKIGLRTLQRKMAQYAKTPRGTNDVQV